MSNSSLIGAALTQMQSAYGRPELPTADSTWALFLRLIFGIAKDHAAYVSVEELLRTAPLATPEETSTTSAARVVELLSPIPRGPQKASVIRALSAWWLTQFENQTSPEWTASLTSYRESLRQIKGLGPATVDELLLFGARLPVFPVDRSVLRIAVRHGWLDLPVEDQDAQSLFIRQHEQDGLDPRELALLLAKVGEEHCGRVPKCEGCPLQSLLPAGGPLNPDSC